MGTKEAPAIKMIKDEELLAKIYAAPLYPNSWADVLDDLASITGSRGAVLGVERHDGWSGWRASNSLEPHISRQIMDNRDTSKSIITPRLKALNLDEFVAEHTIFTDADWLSTPFMRDYGIPNGLKHTAGTFIKLPTGDEILIFCIKDSNKPPFSKSEISRLNELRPHLARATVLTTAIGMSKLDALIFAPDKLSFPVFALDSECRVIKTNDNDFMTLGYFLKHSSGICEFKTKNHDVSLKEIIQSVIVSNSSKSIPIKSSNGRHAVIHIMPMQSIYRELFDMNNVSSNEFQHSSVIAYITEVKHDKNISSSILRYMFDLTGAESRVTADISSGLSVDEIATKSKLSKETVRTHLKSIFSKTGVNRQSQLVSLVASIPTI